MSWDKGLDVLWVNLEHRVSWTLHGTLCYRTERNAAATAPSPLVAISFSDLWFNTRRLRRCWRLQIKDMDLLFTLCVISPNNPYRYPASHTTMAVTVSFSLCTTIILLRIELGAVVGWWSRIERQQPCRTCPWPFCRDSP